MRYFRLTPIALLFLAACAEKPIEQMGYAERQALVSEIVGRCIALGIPENSPQLMQCAEAELQKEVSTREANKNARMAAASALSQAGQNMQMQSRSINCTSSPLGNTVTTRCY